MSDWGKYKRKPSYVEAREYKDGEKLDDSVSISKEDIDNGHPKPGDMIARDPENKSDRWLIRREYFQRNYFQNKVE